jgi:uncharacterized cupredoxin-like copper-binding protein
MTRRRFIGTGAVAGLSIAAVAAAAVVGAEGTPTPASGTPSASPEASPMASPMAETGLTIEMGEFFFKPNMFTIPANTDFVVTLKNTGVVAHDFVVEKSAVSSELIDPSTTGTVTVNLPAGSYQFICSVEGHADAGMYGTVTVE